MHRNLQVVRPVEVGGWGGWGGAVLHAVETDQQAGETQLWSVCPLTAPRRAAPQRTSV